MAATAPSATSCSVRASRKASSHSSSCCSKWALLSRAWYGPRTHFAHARREELDSAATLGALSADVMAASPFVASPFARIPPQRRPRRSRVDPSPMPYSARVHSPRVSCLPANTSLCRWAGARSLSWTCTRMSHTRASQDWTHMVMIRPVSARTKKWCTCVRSAPWVAVPFAPSPIAAHPLARPRRARLRQPRRPRARGSEGSGRVVHVVHQPGGEQADRHRRANHRSAVRDARAAEHGHLHLEQQCQRGCVAHPGGPDRAPLAADPDLRYRVPRPRRPGPMRAAMGGNVVPRRRLRLYDRAGAVGNGATP